MSYYLHTTKKKKRLYYYAIIAILVSLVFFGHAKLAKIFFPFPYQEYVERASQEFQVEPQLILAVMKAESKHQEDAISRKGAVGLMQIMPTTGIWIAEQLQMTDFELEQLSDPEINILFGTWYLSFLLGEFNHQLPVAIASYNAGPGKVKEWLGNNQWDGTYNNATDIPYYETRNYVRKVHIFHQIYKKLYK